MLNAGPQPHWLTPNGLRVESLAIEYKKLVINLNVSGRKVRVYGSDPTDGIDSIRSVKTVVLPDFVHSPDFVYSKDAAFGQKFVDHWSQVRLPLVTVHECFVPRWTTSDICGMS